MLFDEIIAEVSDEAALKSYDGVTLETAWKARPELDNHIMTEDEQRFNIAYYAKMTAAHVGWSRFSEDNRNGFKTTIEEMYQSVQGERRQADFIDELAGKTAHFIEDRHFTIATGSRFYEGGGKKEPNAVGDNLGNLKKMPQGYQPLGEGFGFNGKGDSYPLWKIGEMSDKDGHAMLIVSIPNLNDRNDYQYWQEFIETFDKIYEGERDKWEKGRIVLDVRGNGGGEDKPIDHIAKRLKGNMLNTYKRCVINDTPVGNFILHQHGAYKPKNYEKDGLSAESLLKRQNFSGCEKVLFDETTVFYPFNEEKGYHGRIDVLMDGRTGSSAESAYSSFYDMPNVRYIGENSAGMQQYTQGSFTMPCGVLMRVGATMLTYPDKEGENIEVKGHKPDIDCCGEDAFMALLKMELDTGRVIGFRERNEPVTGKAVFAEYDPKEALDPRKAYYAKYIEEGLKKIETENATARIRERQTVLNGLINKSYIADRVEQTPSQEKKINPVDISDVLKTQFIIKQNGGLNK